MGVSASSISRLSDSLSKKLIIISNYVSNIQTRKGIFLPRVVKSVRRQPDRSTLRGNKKLISQSIKHFIGV